MILNNLHDNLPVPIMAARPAHRWIVDSVSVHVGFWDGLSIHI